MPYQRKTKDEYHLLINYGYGDGYEHEVTEDSFKAIRERLKEYRANCPQYPVKWRKRRIPLENNRV